VDSALHLSSHDELDRDLIEQFNRDLESKAKPARHLGSVEVADDERIERFIEKQLEKYAPFHEQLDANRVSQKVMVHRIRVSHFLRKSSIGSSANCNLILCAVFFFFFFFEFFCRRLIKSFYG
jgi:hypothetical protein